MEALFFVERVSCHWENLGHLWITLEAAK